MRRTDAYVHCVCGALEHITAAATADTTLHIYILAAAAAARARKHRESVYALNDAKVAKEDGENG